MNHQNAIQIILEIVLNTSINAKMPSYYNLSQKYDCSRVVFQKAITELENNNIITLHKSKGGSVLTNINHNLLFNIYYSKLYISCPPSSLESTQDNLIVNILNTLSHLNVIPYFTYSYSSDQQIELLNNNDINFAIVTNEYYQQLNTNHFMVIAKFPIESKNYTQYSKGQLENSTYTLEELPILKASDNTLVPYEYNLISKTSMYNLFTNLSEHK